MFLILADVERDFRTLVFGLDHRLLVSLSVTQLKMEVMYFKVKRTLKLR